MTTSATSFPASFGSALRRPWVAWTFAGFILTWYFIVPPRTVMDVGLDSSNYGTYAQFVAEGKAYGPEVIPMAGPLGFVLYGHTYAGYLFYPRWALEILMKAGFAALVLHLFAHIRVRPLAWGWLAAVLVLTPAVDDLLHDLTLLLAGLVLLRAHHGGSSRWAWFAAALMGPFSLLKGTHLVTASLIVGLSLGWSLCRRRSREGVLQVAVFVGSVLLAWICTGQNPANLPLYVRNTLDLSSGYNATMGLDELPVYFASGLALAIGCIALGGLALWISRREPGRVIALLLLAFFGFIKWKHGFLRADGHVLIFFASVAVLAPTLWIILRGAWFASAAPLPPRLRPVTLALFTAVTTWAVLSASGYSFARLGGIMKSTGANWVANSPYLFTPGHVQRDLETKLTHNRREFDVPQIRNEVGADPIDFFGFEQGVLLLNGLNYQPRPMGGGTFNVFTPRLQQINAGHVSDPTTAPPWFLMKIGYLDDRFAAAEDGSTLRALLNHYSPRLMQRDYLLLHRRSGPTTSATPVLRSETTVQPGAVVEVPTPEAGGMILFSLVSELDLWGRVQSLLYRPPDVTLQVRMGDRELWREFALKPLTVRHPTLISPLVDTNGDIIDLYDPHATSDTPITALRLETEPGFREDSFRITFYETPRPLPPEGTDIVEIRTYADHPLFNREPTEKVFEESAIKELNKEPVQIVHAPGSITWDLQPGDQQILFSYGIMPQAYLDETKTDGVEFNVEIHWADGDGRIIWQRMMRPQRNVEDQGMQRIRLPLPPYEPGMKLRIRTHPGQDNDGAYDQSYVTRFQIKQGPLIGAQFSGLGVVPSSGQLPRDAVAGIGDTPVYLLHAPSQVRIPVPASATRVAFDYGLLPGAYENGGRSDGVEYGVFIRRGDEAPRFVQGWMVNPLHVAADRGRLHRSLELDDVLPGDELVIATNFGPNGDRGWDQSFVANVRFD